MIKLGKISTETMKKISVPGDLPSGFTLPV
jgi:hypothetical protein